MPLPKAGGAVTGVLERFGNRNLRRLDGFSVLGDTIDTGAYGVAPRQDRGSARCTNRVDVEAVKSHAFGAEPVEIRRFEIRVAIQREVAVALIVGEDQEYIGAFSCSLWRRGGKKCALKADGDKKTKDEFHFVKYA